MKWLLFLLIIFIFSSCDSIVEVEENNDFSIENSIELLKVNFRNFYNISIYGQDNDKMLNIKKSFLLGYKKVAKINYRGNVNLINTYSNITNGVVIFENYVELNDELLSDMQKSKLFYFMPVGKGRLQRNYIKNGTFENNLEYWNFDDLGGSSIFEYANPGARVYKNYSSYQYISTKLKRPLEPNEEHKLIYELIKVDGKNPVRFGYEVLGFSSTAVGYHYKDFVPEKSFDSFGFGGFGEEYGAYYTDLVINNIQIYNKNVYLHNYLNNKIPKNLVLSGEGIGEVNDTEYPITLFDKDPVEDKYPFYSNAYLAGKIVAIYDLVNIIKKVKLEKIVSNCYKTSNTNGVYIIETGYGKINVNKAFFYSLFHETNKDLKYEKR